MARISFIAFMLILALTYSTFAWADGRLDFDIDFERKILYLDYGTQDEGSIHISAKFVSDREYYFAADIDRLKLGQSEIIAELNGKGCLKIGLQGEKTFSGNIKSILFFVNHKPINDFNLNYQLAKDSLRIDSFYWDGVSTRCSLGLTPPYNLDSVIYIKGLDLNNISRPFGQTGNGKSIFGLDRIMNADIRIKGPLKTLYATARILGEDIEQETDIRRIAHLNLQGTLPLLKFVNSRIIEDSGVEYTIEGQFDFTKVFNKTPAHNNYTQVALANDSAFRWEDWVISRNSILNGKDSVEFKYSLDNDNYLRMGVADTQETEIVWEKNIKF